MLFQVGGQGSRPTFFEMAAAEQLPRSLRAALTYSIGVLALRNPFLHKLLDYEDESFSLLMLVLEAHSLRTTDASFSESLYGLRRRPSNIKLNNNDATTSTGSHLQRRQKLLSLLFLVVLPYLKSKLHSIYNKEREARLQASLWGDENEGYVVDDDDVRGGFESDSLVSTATLDARARIRKRLQKIVGFCYPWLHAGTEGLQFAYQMLYLLDATGYYSLALHALGIHVCRATGQELMDASSRISKIRSRERERLRGPQWLKTLQGAFLSCTYNVLDYAQTGLIAAVFFFKMMEWWYQSAEERMSAPTVYPPPPPPPPPKVAKEGLPLPPDRTMCPLCTQKRVNPSVITVSGFVFCYACVFKYITQISNFDSIWFIFLFLSTFATGILDMSWSGVGIEEWWINEQFWVIGGVSAHLFAVFQGLLKVVAGTGTNFIATSRELYKFKWTPLLIAPTTLLILNLVGVVAGISSVVTNCGVFFLYKRCPVTLMPTTVDQIRRLFHDV